MKKSLKESEESRAQLVEIINQNAKSANEHLNDTLNTNITDNNLNIKKIDDRNDNIKNESYIIGHHLTSNNLMEDPNVSKIPRNCIGMHLKI